MLRKKSRFYSCKSNGIICSSEIY